MENQMQINNKSCAEIHGGFKFEVGTEIIWFVGMVLRKTSDSPTNSACGNTLSNIYKL